MGYTGSLYSREYGIYHMQEVGVEGVEVWGVLGILQFILYLSHSNQSDFSITSKYCFVFYRGKKYTPIAYVKRVPDSVPVVQMFRKLW